MKFQPDETITLGNYQYTIQRRLGQGAITDAYQAIPLLNEGDTPPVVIKTPVNDEPDIITQVKREIEALDILNRGEMPAFWATTTDLSERLQLAQETASRRLIIVNLDSGLLSTDQPYIVQEFAPPEFDRFDIRERSDEIRMLTVVHALSRALALAHQNGLAFKDFEPQTKGDRLRVRWLDEAQTELEFKVTDWNITGTAADFSQDLILFGGHLYYLLLGHYLILNNNEPPANLSLGIEGNWNKLSIGSRQIIQRLLHRDPKRRYHSAADLEADLSWWLTTVQQSIAHNASSRLNDRLNNAQISGNQERVLAIADLALALSLPESSRGIFQFYRDKAEEKIKNEVQFPISAAISELSRGGTGGFTQAINGFQKALAQHDSRSEVAQLARRYLYLAQAGLILTQEMGDISSAPVWGDLNRANNALRQSQWYEADTALIQAKNRDPIVSTCKPVNDMLALALAGKKVNDAVKQLELARSRPAEAARSDWTHSEQQKLIQVEKAVALLKEAQEQAPDEPEIADLYQRELTQLERRQTFLQKYQDTDQLLNTAEAAWEEGKRAESSAYWSDAAAAYQQTVDRLNEAFHLWDEILQVDTAQSRALHLKDKYRERQESSRKRLQDVRGKAEALRQTTEAVQEAQQLLQNGHYDQALPQARRANSLSPDDERTKVLLDEAEIGNRLLESAYLQLTTAQQNQAARRLGEARDLVTQLLGWDRRPFAELATTHLPGMKVAPIISSRLFVQKDTLKQELETLRQTLSGAILQQQQEEQRRNTLNQQLQEYRDQELVEDIISVLEAEQAQRSLSFEEQDLLDWARQKVEDFQQVESTLVSDALTFEQIRADSQRLGNEQGPRSRAYRSRLATAWISLVKQLSLDKVADLQEVVRRLQEGGRLFVDSQEMRLSLGQAQQMINIAEALVEPGQEWPDTPPNWMMNTANLNATLLRWAGQDDGLLKLRTTPNWSQLTLLADQWTKNLIDYLVALLQPSLETSRRLSQEKQDFQAAQKEAQHIWEQIPADLQNLLPADVGKEGFARLLPALTRRLTADEQFMAVLDRLNRAGKDALTFAEAVQEVATVDVQEQDRHVAVADLQTRLADWQKGKTWETQTLSTPIDENEYAQVINALFEAINEIDSGEKLSPQTKAELSAKLRALRTALKNRAETVYETLVEKLVVSGKAVLSQSDSEIQPFLGLYAQARWIQAAHYPYGSGQDEAPQTTNTPDPIATSLLDKLWQQAVKKFSQSEKPGESLARRGRDLAETEAILKKVSQLVDEVISRRMPTGLPAVVLEVVKLPVDREQLNKFADVVVKFKGWADYDLETGQRTDPEGGESEKDEPKTDTDGGRKYRPSRVAAAQETILAVQESLPAVPTEVTQPGLSEEIERLKACLQTLQNAYETYRQTPPQPMAGLSQHLAQIDKKYQTDDGRWAWLLGPEQDIVRRGYADLRADLIQSLEEQLRAVVTNDQTAVASLEAFIRDASQAGESIVQAAYEAISRLLGVGGAKVEDGQTQNGKGQKTPPKISEGERATIRRYCKYVRVATLPWLKEKPPLPVAPEIVKTWQSLHALAQEVDKSLGGLSPEEIRRRRIRNTVIGVPLLVFLCTIVYVFGFYRPGVQEIERSGTATTEYFALLTREATQSAGLSGNATADAQALATQQAAQMTTAASDAALLLTQNAIAAGGFSAEATQTAQANAAIATANSVQGTAVANAFATEQAGTATALYLANECRDITRYNFTVSPSPILVPNRGTVQIIGDSSDPTITATWLITNTGTTCPMQNLQLLYEDGTVFAPLLLRFDDNVRIYTLQPGESAQLSIYFSENFVDNPSFYGTDIDWEWVVLVDNPGNADVGFELSLRQHPQLVLKVNRWVIAVTPTPTPTATYTPTPVPLTPTDTPVPPILTPVPPVRPTNTTSP